MSLNSIFYKYYIIFSRYKIGELWASFKTLNLFLNMRFIFAIFIYFAGKFQNFTRLIFTFVWSNFDFYKALSQWMQDSTNLWLFNITIKWNELVALNLWNVYIQSRCFKQFRRFLMYLFTHTTKDKINRALRVVIANL